MTAVQFRKDHCENTTGFKGFICGTIQPTPSKILDIVFKDGNPRNTNASNLQTLCKVCAAL
jgi:hypothetical protein